MRLYTFCNMYLSSIQQGIQSAHVTHELFYHYPDREGPNGNELLWDWVELHKTIIVLNGGFNDNLSTLEDFFNTAKNQFPWATFNEGDDALGGLMTCVGIVLPERIYDGAQTIRDPAERESVLNTGIIEVLDKTGEVSEAWSYTKWEFKLMELLNTFHLAR